MNSVDRLDGAWWYTEKVTEGQFVLENVWVIIVVSEIEDSEETILLNILQGRLDVLPNHLGERDKA